MKKVVVFFGWVFASIFVGIVTSFLAMFVVAGISGDQYAGESFLALLSIPQVLVPLSFFVGLILALKKLGELNSEVN